MYIYKYIVCVCIYTWIFQIFPIYAFWYVEDPGMYVYCICICIMCVYCIYTWGKVPVGRIMNLLHLFGRSLVTGKETLESFISWKKQLPSG